MIERIRHMLVKEFIQIFRDARMKGVIFLMPIIQVLVFGYAVTTDVRNVPTVLRDMDGTRSSRELAARFLDSGYFRLVEHAADDRHAIELMDRGKAAVILTIPSGFEADLLAGRTSDVQVIADGSDSNTAGIVMDYSSRIVSTFSEDVLAKRHSLVAGGGRPLPRIEPETRAWFNENLESRNFYVPGVIAIIVMLVTLMLTSMAVVREKEIGTMEQIMVTPISPSEFILGKTVPFAVIGLADVVLITAVGAFWFDVPIRGSLGLLFAATMLYLMTTLGVGLLISTVSRTQQEAMMSAFFFYFPAVLLSGFMFPIANMPQPIQWLTWINPLRYFLVVLRGVFLKGVGPEILWPHMTALAVLGVVTLWFASRRFRKTLA
jgi:ABC-2 type transport system permease protein